VRKLVLLLALAGCGEHLCDFEVRGGCVFDETAAMTPDRFLSVVRLADKSWGTIDLDGWYFHFLASTEPFDCGGKEAVGCTRYGPEVVEVFNVSDPLDCSREAVLFHELGHVADHGASHEDPRFAIPYTIFGLCQE